MQSSLLCIASPGAVGRRLFRVLLFRARRRHRHHGPDPRPLVGRDDGPVVGVVPVHRHSVRGLAAESGAAQSREVVAEVHP